MPELTRDEVKLIKEELAKEGVSGEIYFNKLSTKKRKELLKTLTKMDENLNSHGRIYD